MRQLAWIVIGALGSGGVLGFPCVVLADDHATPAEEAYALVLVGLTVILVLGAYLGSHFIKSPRQRRKWRLFRKKGSPGSRHRR